MVCPVCGSDEAVILKNKLIKGKNKEIREFLLKCDECGSVYNERISQDNPKPFRLITTCCWGFPNVRAWKSEDHFFRA